MVSNDIEAVPYSDQEVKIRFNHGRLLTSILLVNKRKKLHIQ